MKWIRVTRTEPCRIITTNQFVVLVDANDYEVMSRHKWRAQPDGKTHYAVRMELVNGKTTCVRMHRQIMGFPSGFVDHNNRNGLDNRRENLRLATNAQNQANSLGHYDAKNPHKGICWVEKRKRWNARLTIGGKRTHIGWFRELPDAITAWELANYQAYGDFTPI